MSQDRAVAQIVGDGQSVPPGDYVIVLHYVPATPSNGRSFKESIDTPPVKITKVANE